MAYKLAAILMTLSHLQGHSLLQTYHVIFFYSCAAVDKILSVMLKDASKANNAKNANNG